MNIMTKARAFVLATLLAFSVGVALPSTDAKAHGFSYKSTMKQYRTGGTPSYVSGKPKASRRSASRNRHRASRSASQASRNAHRRTKRSAKRLHKTSRYARKSNRKSVRKSRSANRANTKRRHTRTYRKNQRMSLGATVTTHTRSATRTPSSSGKVSWSASSSCLNGRLKSVVYQVAARYGSLRVNSTCRSRARNRRAGGARHSHHLTGNAVDFRVFGNVRAVASFLRSHGSVGGYKHYGGGLFHIDTGPRRTW